ncbi:hypothetical protein HY68_11765 [Streptomyces sp. AcH 505]|uniref:helix-turn-helix transcriptional regulator n=1 Tax=unclassified Streptomyces TaxID=2593676 RepID=UPI000591D3F9|nr:helix-turn-helix transcriptional regulator [Streptomyces sp. NBC_00370]KIF69110.1 hypothetical protein HY68_11765 [Streptomyces sp. AcH 505]
MAREAEPARDSLLPLAARELYARLAAGEDVPPDAEGLASLHRRGLARTDPASGHVSVLDLDDVEQRLRGSVRDALTHSVGLVAELHTAVDDLRARHAAARPGAAPSPGALFVEGKDAVNRSIAAACDSAREEMLCAQPGPRTRRSLALAEGRDTELLERGVSVRTLYRASNKTNPAVHERVRTMRPKGGQFRTLASPFLLMIIFDRRLAFLVDRLEGRPAADGAWQVRDPAVCAFLADVFEQQWVRADEWLTPAPSGAPVVSTQLQRAILRELCAGHDQQQIAKTLGYSARTVNAHLTDLRGRLGFRTVYQLTHWWATCEERELD